MILTGRLVINEIEKDNANRNQKKQEKSKAPVPVAKLVPANESPKGQTTNFF